MAWQKALAGFLGNLGGSMFEKVLGAGAEYQFSKRAAQDNIRRMQKLGLTPQEMVGGSAGGGMSASGPVLGNAPAMQAAVEQREREKDRQLERERIGAGIYQTQTQAQATLGAAETAARASIYSTDTTANTAADRLGFDREQFQLTVEKHPAELQKLANEAITSSPGFLQYMKALGMSAENLRATAIYQKWASQGFDVLDPEDWASATDGERKMVIREMTAHAATIYTEGHGALQGASEVGGALLDRPRLEGMAPIWLWGRAVYDWSKE